MQWMMTRQPVNSTLTKPKNKKNDVFDQDESTPVLNPTKFLLLLVSGVILSTDAELGNSKDSDHCWRPTVETLSQKKTNLYF